MGLLVVLNSLAYSRWFHPSQFAIVNPKVQVLESLGAANFHTVQICNSSSDYKNPALFVPDASVNESLRIKGVGAIPVTLLGYKWLVAINHGLCELMYIRPNVRFNSEDRHQVVGLIDYLELQTNLAEAGTIWPNAFAYSDWNDIDPLPQRYLLQVNALIGGSGSPPGFARLPNDSSQREHKRPCSDTLRPCYEFVPPLRVILAAFCLCCAVAINAYGCRWIRLLCILPLLCTGWLILGGHKYWCQDDGREYDHDPRHYQALEVLEIGWKDFMASRLSVEQQYDELEAMYAKKLKAAGAQ